MAHEITGSDRLVLSRGNRAWHGLGEVLEGSPTVSEAIARTMPWSVVLAAGVSGIAEMPGNPQPVRVMSDEARIVVRSDDASVLGVVGPDYSPIQNAAIGDFAESLSSLGDRLTAETAGTIRGGRRCWLLCPRGDVDLIPGDRAQRYLAMTWGHDGTLSFEVRPTAIRIVCSNTFHAALGASARIRIRHTGDTDAKLAAARRILAAEAAGITDLQQAAGKLAARRMTADELAAFWGEVYAREVLGEAIPTAAKAAADKAARRKREAAMDDLGSVRRRWGIETEQGKGGYTAWAAVNAIGGWAEHDRHIRAADNTARRAARIERRVTGKAADFAAAAMQLALA